MIRSNRASIAVHLFAVAITVLPFALIVLGAMSSNAAIARLDFSKISFSTLLANFSEVLWQHGALYSAILNTLILCAAMLAFQIPAAVLSAFAFAFFEFKGKKLAYAILLASFLVPSVTTVLPLFFIMTAMGLKGSPIGILLPYILFSPYALALLRDRFEAIPQELIDQGRIDGLSNFGLLAKLVVPVSKSFIWLLSLITFVAMWNAFLWPRLIAGNSWPTVTIAIGALQGQYDSAWNLVLAATVLALIPATAAFVISQKNLVNNYLEEIDL
jgi:multiple sugar transport system permease protein